MDCPCFNIGMLLLTGCVVVASGCGRDGEGNADGGIPAATNAPASVSSAPEPPPEKPTADMLAANRMSHLLDDGDRAGALALARTLMDSPEQKVRLVVIDTMGWMGKVTLPELVELMEHEDEVTAEAALVAWEHAFGEIENDALRIGEVIKAVKSLKRQKMIETVLFHLDECDENTSLRALSNCIAETVGMSCNPIAKDAYERLADEPWVSSARTEVLISKVKGKGEK